VPSTAGPDAGDYGRVTELARTQRELLALLKPGEWNIVLGVELARLINAQVGEKVTLMAPGGQVTPAGVVPRLKQFTLEPPRGNTTLRGRQGRDGDWQLVSACQDQRRRPRSRTRHVSSRKRHHVPRHRPARRLRRWIG
jgi:hypothetical protein